jgi:hypothetical protein
MLFKKFLRFVICFSYLEIRRLPIREEQRTAKAIRNNDSRCRGASANFNIRQPRLLPILLLLLLPLANSDQLRRGFLRLGTRLRVERIL